ncbi:hypothetical protein [Spiroplasma endosymbiont of Polydrusus pterygomalis]|uniref:hypothetical protein n=1 Tax=Spiroplasma endosymbiont of Polydrusus pterygomalis TaxID=3139327 RepID=UPI003CCA9F30
MMCLNLTNYNSNYAFEENDMLVFDELGLKINSNDLSLEFKATQESLGMFCKLIGHNFNGIMYMIEQHPDRILKQAGANKVEYIVQVKSMRILLFLVKFKLNIYPNVDDYNKVILSQRQMKPIINVMAYHRVIVMKLWFLVYDFHGLIYNDIIVVP